MRGKYIYNYIIHSLWAGTLLFILPKFGFYFFLQYGFNLVNRDELILNFYLGDLCWYQLAGFFSWKISDSIYYFFLGGEISSDNWSIRRMHGNITSLTWNSTLYTRVKIKRICVNHQRGFEGFSNYMKWVHRCIENFPQN